MPIFDISSEQRPLIQAFAVSLAIHLLLLFAVHTAAPPRPAAALRLEASLASSQSPAPPPAVETKPSDKPPTPSKAAKPQARTRVLTTNKAGRNAAPTWTTAQKAEMDGFLNELAEQAKAAPKPSLAQRSMAMAREQGRQMAARDEAGEAMLERRPNGPPADPFSLEMYLDGLVRRLNRSASYVRNDPRSKGLRSASVQFRLNPDGSLKSFVVLNAGDQADEIAFIKSVVERSIPFSPFPPDIDKAARSLGVTICIEPGSSGESGLGFTRMDGGRCR